MSRAAVLAAGATLMGAAAACDGDPPTGNDAATMADAAITQDSGAGGSDATTGNDAADDRGAVALYGAPAPEYGAPPTVR
jgi:hypothetical protein